ncbi:endonuclease/exonuclease/phosphatase family protein [Streptomyces sp. NPDC102402]|uniref:endonuclease/exonuclease/phosphatase family protein n=1 Tax=Streptomyces sp. NPDC102402 TaxID=3366169 RepID=UPI0037F7A341
MIHSRRRRRFVRRAVVCATVVCLAVLATPLSRDGGSSVAGTSGRLRIATWNLCGVEQWGCRNTGTHREKIAVIEDLAATGGVRAFMLQEVCTTDLDDAMAALGGGWHSAFRAYAHRDGRGRLTPVFCTGGARGRAGFALLSSSPLSEVARVPSPQPSVGLQRGILCASLASRRVRICNAHLSVVGADDAHPSWEYRDDQLKALFSAADPRTVTGGDFNSSPPSASNRTYRWIWPRTAYGRYQECDQRTSASRTGRATHRSGVKLDYLFTQLDTLGCSVRRTRASDHSALVMTVGTR